MAEKYKIKITKAYHIAIEDKDGYEVASDWSFLDYRQTKQQAWKLRDEVERKEKEIDNNPTVKAIHEVTERIEKEWEKVW